jgi:hypothetical protein
VEIHSLQLSQVKLFFFTFLLVKSLFHEFIKINFYKANENHKFKERNTKKINFILYIFSVIILTHDVVIVLRTKPKWNNNTIVDISLCYFFGSLLSFILLRSRLYVCCVEDEKHFIVKKLFWVKLHACKGVLLKLLSTFSFECIVAECFHRMFQCFTKTFKAHRLQSMKEIGKHKERKKILWKIHE